MQPFEAETVTGLCAKIVADEPVPLRAVRPDVPPAFEAVVLRCLEKNPASRYQSVAELATALRPFASPDGRASVARIVRTGGGSKRSPSRARSRRSPAPRIPAPVRRMPVFRLDARASLPTRPSATPRPSLHGRRAPIGRRGKQVKTASVATAAFVAIVVIALVAAKWPRGPAPSPDPSPAVSAPARSVIPPPCAGHDAAAGSGGGRLPRPCPVRRGAARTARRRPRPLRRGARAPAAPFPHRPPATARPPIGAAPAAKTTDDLLLDRK